MIQVSISPGLSAGNAGSGRRRDAGQQVGEVVKAQTPTRELIVVGTNQRPAIVDAAFQGMSASCPYQSIHELIGLAYAPPRNICRRAETFEAAYHDRRQAAFCARDQADTGRIEGRVEGRKQLSKAIEADPGFIDEPVRENLRQVHAGQLHSRWHYGLICRKFGALPTVQRKGLIAVAEHIPAAEAETFR